MWYRLVKKAVKELDKPLITRHKTKGLYGVPVWGMTDENDPTVQLGAGSKAFGPGHYTSLNPSVTAGYAGRYTRLEVIPAGARIIDYKNIPIDHGIKIVKKLQELGLINKGNDDEYLLGETHKFDTLEKISMLMGSSKRFFLNSVLLSLGYDAISYPSYTYFTVPRLNNESEEDYKIRAEKIKASGDNILILNRAMLAVPRLFEKSRFDAGNLSYAEIDKLQSEMYLSEKELIKVLPKNQQKTLVMNPKYFDLFSDSDLLETFSEEELRGFVLSVYPSVKNRIVKILNIPIEDIYADVLQDEDNFSLVLKDISPEYMKVLNLLNEKDISNNISIKFLGNYIAGEHFQSYPINITFTDQYISEYIDNSDFEIWLKGNNLKDKSGRYLTEAEKGGIIKSALLPENYYREHPFNNDISNIIKDEVVNSTTEDLSADLCEIIRNRLNYLRSSCFQCGEDYSIKDLGDSCSNCGYDGHGFKCRGCGEYKEDDGECEHCGFPDYKCPECGAEDNFENCSECGRNILCPSCDADYYVSDNGCDACGGPFQCSGCGEYLPDDHTECDCGYEPNTNDGFGG
jgi:hypothetical protein